MTSEPTLRSHYPLSGLRVIEIAEGVAGSYCARLFADGGADVVKIEPPHGDPVRREPPFAGPAGSPNASALFAYLNRGKRSVVMDAGSAHAQAAFRSLLPTADVVVHDSRDPSESLAGMTPDQLLEDFPELVTVSITPFGESGPYANLLADDLIAASMGGLLAASPGFPDHVVSENEPPLRVNAHISELIGGAFGAIGGLTALSARDVTGTGDYVEVTLHESVAALLGWNLAVAEYGGAVVGRYRVPARQAPNHYLPCADGWVALVAFLERHWNGLVELMGSPEWAARPEFATGPERGANWDLLEPLILDWLIEQPAQLFFEAAQLRGIPSCPALSLSEALGSDQARARDALVPIGLPDAARGLLPGDPFVIDGKRRKAGGAVPALGEHSAEVLDGAAERLPGGPAYG